MKRIIALFVVAYWLPWAGVVEAVGLRPLLSGVCDDTLATFARWTAAVVAAGLIAHHTTRKEHSS